MTLWPSTAAHRPFHSFLGGGGVGREGGGGGREGGGGGKWGGKRESGCSSINDWIFLKH